MCSFSLKDTTSEGEKGRFFVLTRKQKGESVCGKDRFAFQRYSILGLDEQMLYSKHEVWGVGMLRKTFLCEGVTEPRYAVMVRMGIP